MFDKEAIKQSFSKSATAYDNNAILQAKIRSRAASLMPDYFSDNSTILDIGCGTGEFAGEVQGHHVIGLDIAYGMCVVASSKNSLVINADAGNLPIADETFDCVFSSLFLQWAENPEIVIKEILRVLKAGGTAIITTFTHGTLSELEQAFAAVDSKIHISPFMDSAQLLLKIAHIGGLVLEFDEKTYVEYYDDVLSLMRSIKNIGASNKHNKRRKGLMTPAQLQKVAEAYKHSNGKFPASWKVVTMAIGKI